MKGDEEKRSSGPSTRTAALAAAGVVLILGLAYFVAAVVVPVLHTHAILGEICSRGGGSAEGRVTVGTFWAIGPEESCTQRLGGPEGALERVLFYVRLPRWIAPRRVQACAVLAGCGRPAVGVLAGLLKDPDARVRLYAAGALSYMKTEAKDAVPALLAALRDPDAHVRANAAWALGQIGPASPEVVANLTRALSDESGAVRLNATGALDRMGPEAREAIPALVNALKTGPHSPRETAASALASIGEDAAPALAGSLSDADPVVRSLAAEALMWMAPGKAQAAVPALLRALKDEDVFVRRDAAYALGNAGLASEEVLAALKEALKDEGVVHAADMALRMLPESSRNNAGEEEAPP